MSPRARAEQSRVRRTMSHFRRRLLSLQKNQHELSHFCLPFRLLPPTDPLVSACATPSWSIAVQEHVFASRVHRSRRHRGALQARLRSAVEGVRGVHQAVTFSLAVLACKLANDVCCSIEGTKDGLNCSGTYFDYLHCLDHCVRPLPAWIALLTFR